MGPGPLLPPVMLLVAGFAAFVAMLPRLRRPHPLPRLAGEAFAVGILAIAVVQALWFAYWWLEQRW